VAQLGADWGDLKGIAAWTPLTEMQGATRHLGGTLFQLSATQYLICPSSNERFERLPGIPGFVAALLWAQHEGAARRAILMETEADRPELRPPPEPPPPELLLPGVDDTYGSILAELRTQRDGSVLTSAAYRVARDGAFIHRKIGAAPYTFFFRNRKDDDADPCYAIEFRLPGFEKAAEHARSLRDQARLSSGSGPE
jgi:hypothetical protein